MKNQVIEDSLEIRDKENFILKEQLRQLEESYIRAKEQAFGQNDRVMAELQIENQGRKIYIYCLRKKYRL